jgi:hypothetical protein
LTKTGFAASVNLASRLVHDPGAGSDILRLMFDDRLLRDLSVATDLRIETGHSIYGGIPWELARTLGSNDTLLSSHPKIGCVYRCVSDDLSASYLIASAQEGLVASNKAKLAVDGVMGPATYASVKDFQSKHGLPVTGGVDAATHAAIAALRRAQEPSRRKSVVIIRRGYRAQVSRTRGVAFSAFDVADEYKRAGWLVVVLDDPSKSAIKDAVLKSRALVVHVNAPVAEGTRTGGLYVDVGRDVGESVAQAKSSARPAVRRTQGLPVADLVECLRGTSLALSPVLVLDPPSVPTDTEAVRQLILRNAFASDVFQHSVVPAIVGTGLLEGDEYRDVGAALVGGFESGQSLGVVCERMRRVARPNWQGVVPFPATTALYSHYADYALSPPASVAIAR